MTTSIVKFVRRLFKALKREVGSLDPDLPDSAEAQRLWAVEAQSALVQDTNFGTWRKQFNMCFDPHGVWRCGG